MAVWRMSWTQQRRIAMLLSRSDIRNRVEPTAAPGRGHGTRPDIHSQNSSLNEVMFSSFRPVRRRKRTSSGHSTHGEPPLDGWPRQARRTEL